MARIEDLLSAQPKHLAFLSQQPSGVPLNDGYSHGDDKVWPSGRRSVRPWRGNRSVSLWFELKHHAMLHEKKKKKATKMSSGGCQLVSSVRSDMFLKAADRNICCHKKDKATLVHSFVSRYCLLGRCEFTLSPGRC